MKVFTESLISEMKPTETSNKPSSVLCVMTGPCMFIVSRIKYIYYEEVTR